MIPAPWMLPDESVVIVALVGDELAIGKSALTAEVYRDAPAGLPDLTGCLIWNKWTISAGASRDTVTADGTAGVLLTKGLGPTANDTGPEYGLALGLRDRVYAGRAFTDSGAPTILVVKYGVVGMGMDARETDTLAPLDAAADAGYKVLRTGYLLDAIAWAKANYGGGAYFGGLALATGLIAATGANAGAAESFLAQLRAFRGRLTAELGLDDMPMVGIAPPLVDRGTYPDIDLVRWAWQAAHEQGVVEDFVDADQLERCANSDPALLTGQGAFDLGAQVAKIMGGIAPRRIA